MLSGQEYKQLRLSKGISTYDLQKAGIGANTYTNIEADGNYTVKSLEKYLKVLNK